MHSIDKVGFARWVRDGRENLGLSRAQFAKRCGLSVSTTKNIENGRHVPAAITLQKLNKVLEPAAKPTPLSNLIRDTVKLLLQYAQPLPMEALALLIERTPPESLVDAMVAAKVDRQKLGIALLQRGDHE